MAFITGTTMKVLINQFDMSGYFRTINPTMERGMYDTTAFGVLQKQFVPGFTGGTIDGETLWEDPVVGTPSAPGNVFYTIDQTTTPVLVSVAPEGLTPGKRLYMLRAQKATHTVAAKIDDLVLGTANFQANDGMDVAGVSLHTLQAETSFPFTGTDVDNGILTSNGGVAFLHVTAIAGGAPALTFKVQHSPDGSSWADLVTTFASVTTATFDRVLVAIGTLVNRHLRVTITNTGTTTSVTFVAGFARR
jgi:hypothetical protein